MVSGQERALDGATELPRRPVARQSVLPEASEPVRRKLCVAHGVLDISVAEVNAEAIAYRPPGLTA